MRDVEPPSHRADRCLWHVAGLWAAEHYHCLELAAEDDVIDKIAYVAANPTDAGLVESPNEWPGVLLLTEPDGRTLAIRRPTTYFTNDGAFPETVTLQIAPFVERGRSAADTYPRVARAIEHAVGRARQGILECGRAFLGRDAVLGQSFAKRAESFEPRRGPIPQVRARNRALLKAILATYQVFRAGYRVALSAWRGGDRGAVFPFGTWAMRLLHRASTAVGSG